MSENLENTPKKLSQRLADFTLAFNVAAAPQRVLENAKLAILDCLAVSILAASQEIGTALLNFARENVEKGDCTIWGTGLTAGPRDAALINGTLAHGLDYDDRNHSSTYNLATSLAVAEHLNLSGAKMLEGFIVGREVRNSLDPLFGKRSSGIGPGARGWHSNGILGPIAAGCVASKLLGLNIEQTTAAIGLAAGSSGALTRDGGTMAKPFRTGHAASTGLTCALLAKNGFSSDGTPLEGRYGLLEALGPIPEDLLQSLASDLGSKFSLETELRIKPYSSCTATHSELEAILRLTQKHSIKPDSVEFIDCDLKPYPLVRLRPQRGFEGRFSMAFCLAMGLIHHELNPDDFTDEHVKDPWVEALMSRTRHSPGARSLVITLKNGTRLEENLKAPSNLNGWEAVKTKFEDCIGSMSQNGRGQTIPELVGNLETIPSVRVLTNALSTSN